jgi:aspartyl-tRNA(Asn)/glutamyl-tRNA(Gln) amidotransferase subunit A
MNPTPSDPALMSAEELLALYARQSLSPVEAVQAVTDRIERLNPAFNAFAIMNPEAQRQAVESAARWRACRPLGPLDGVPVTIKDVIDVAGLPTRRGSRLTEAAPAEDDAPLVTALRASGAVLLGKTTTTEYGWKTPGDCPLHGATRNPWNPELTTGGSSAGAGAAAAACLGPLHIGTDAGGSVRIPAAWCGVVGLKPSFGRVPQWPLGLFGPLSVAGPITRTVRDAALLLGVAGRHDWRDPFALPDDDRDWRASIEEGVAELRVAVLRTPGFDAPVEWDGIAAVEEAARLLTEAGAEVEEADPGLPDVRDVFGRLWSVACGQLVERVPETRRHMLDPGLLLVAAQAADVPASAMLEAERLRVLAAHAMARLHTRYDLVLCPTVPAGPMPADAPVEDPATALWTQWAPWTLLFNLTRQPAISVPMGFAAHGLPRAVQVAAALYRDDLVLRAARTLELAQPFPIPEL